MGKTKLDEKRDRDIWEGWFKEAKKCSLEDGSLQKFLDHLKNDYVFDYGTSARATAAAACATANAFARYIGLTMFQWSCAGMDIVGRMLLPNNKLGYRLIDYDDLFYPQYEYRFLEHKLTYEEADLLKQEAQSKIAETGGLYVSPNVLAWWEKLAKGEFPEWLEIQPRRICNRQLPTPKGSGLAGERDRGPS